jgi:DhnA family fructose-bisphosphate aldolase class Ia
MIIDKGIAQGEVLTFKLANGDEMIAKLVEETNVDYKVSKPLVLSMSPQGIGMIPFMFTANHEKSISINKNSVMAVQTTDKQFADQYTQGTTGIALG